MSKKKYSQDELITRAYVTEFRAIDDEEGILEGTPIVFEKPTKLRDWSGEYFEVIDKRALDNANLDDVRLFINHNMDKITLARSKKGNENSTMSINVDDAGLHFKAKLDIKDNLEARALYSAVKRGDMDAMSFAFRIKDFEWSDLESDTPTMRIKEISIVHEVSVVNFPAYPQTSVSARSSGEETPTSLLVEARKAYAEETARRNELEIERLKNENLLKLGGKL